MGVKISFVRRFLFLLIFFSACASSSTKIEIDELIGDLQKNINISTLVLSEKIKWCDKNRARNTPLIVGAKVYDDSKRRQVITAFTYLSHRNMFNCTSESKMKLAFDLGTLKQVRLHYKLDISDISEIESNLIYPSIKEIELANNYKKLPLEIKLSLEKIVDELPFDLLDTINKNNLRQVKRIVE